MSELMKSCRVELTDHHQALVGELVGSGRYKDVAEVLREGLRLLERREREHGARLALLRQRLERAEAEVAVGQVSRYRPGLLDELDGEERDACQNQCRD